METEPTSEMSCFFKNLDDGQSSKKEIVSVVFSRALFSVLSTHEDFAMQALVWLCMVWFRAIQFGTVQFGTSYTNLR
jgi:hypothetical protein